MKKFSVKKKSKRKPSVPKRQKVKQASDIDMNSQAKSSFRRKRKVDSPQKLQRRNRHPFAGVFLTEDEELYLTSDDDDCGQYGFHEPELPRKPLKNYDLDYVLAKRVSVKKRKSFSGAHTQGDSATSTGHKKDLRQAKFASRDQSAKHLQQQQLKKDITEVNASSASAAGSGDRRTFSHSQKKQQQQKCLQATEKVPIVLYKVNVFSEDDIPPPLVQQNYVYQQKIPPYIVKSLFGKWTDNRQQRHVRMGAVADAQES